jgi:hypothetical protein
MLTPEQIAKTIDHAEGFGPQGVSNLIDMLERQAVASEAWAAQSSYKGDKRKASALAEAKRLRDEAAQLRTYVLR